MMACNRAHLGIVATIKIKENIDDISANAPDVLEVTLSGVDIPNLISEVGQENILDELSLDDIKEYIESREARIKEEQEDVNYGDEADKEQN